MITTQKEVIQWCHLQTGGDQSATIEMYAEYDEMDYVPRDSDVQPLDSHAYATILWHSAVKLEWFA